MTRYLALVLLLLISCDINTTPPEDCGQSTTIVVTPVGGDSARVVRLTPVCEDDSL